MTNTEAELAIQQKLRQREEQRMQALRDRLAYANNRIAELEAELRGRESK